MKQLESFGRHGLRNLTGAMSGCRRQSARWKGWASACQAEKRQNSFESFENFSQLIQGNRFVFLAMNDAVTVGAEDNEIGNGIHLYRSPEGANWLGVMYLDEAASYCSVACAEIK